MQREHLETLLAISIEQQSAQNIKKIDNVIETIKIGVDRRIEL